MGIENTAAALLAVDLGRIVVGAVYGAPLLGTVIILVGVLGGQYFAPKLSQSSASCTFMGVF